MYALELKPGKISWFGPSPELCLRLSNAVLLKSPKNPRARVVLELYKHPEQDDDESDEKESNHVPVCVLTKDNDNVPLSIFINSSMGLRLLGKGCAGAVVHVTGTKFTPEEDMPFGGGSMPLPEYFCENPNGACCDGDSDDSDYELEKEEEDNDNDENDADKGKIEEDDDDTKEEVKMQTRSKKEEKIGKQKKNEKEVKKNGADEDKEMSDAIKPATKNSKNQAQSKETKKPSKSENEPSKKKAEKRKAAAVSPDEPSKKKTKKVPVTSIVNHPSGLQYQDMIKGTGKRAQHGHNVAIQYVLRLENGKVVDKADRKRPFMFRLGIGECIKGFDLGVGGMREGGERHLIVPPTLGYGDQKLAGIPSGSTLYFDVTVVKAF